MEDPAAFRRLCVETWIDKSIPCPLLPAAFRRLCVETQTMMFLKSGFFASRLQAAVC